MSGFADHKKPRRRDLRGCKHSPARGSALHKAKLISAATERGIESLWSFLRGCKVNLTVGFSSFPPPFPLLFSLLGRNAAIREHVHMELRCSWGLAGRAAGPAQSPTPHWQLWAGTKHHPLPSWQTPLGPQDEHAFPPSLPFPSVCAFIFESWDPQDKKMAFLSFFPPIPFPDSLSQLGQCHNSRHLQTECSSLPCDLHVKVKLQ